MRSAGAPEAVINKNQLFEALPRKDLRSLQRACEHCVLELFEVLCEIGVAASHVYFPTEGFISLSTANGGGPGLVVSTVGREGMLGTQLALGVLTAPCRAIVQVAGTAWRIDVASFARELKDSAALRRILNNYVYVCMAQMTTAATCHRFHLIGARLARCLLAYQDQTGSANLSVTQQLLAETLGVRRVSVTSAARVLQRSRLVEYHRGELVVLDRKGLKAASCSCYAADRRDYRRMFSVLERA